MEALARTEDLARACARLRGVLRARMLLRSQQLVEAEPTPADPERLAELEARLRLPPLYVEYLRHHHSKAFARDFDLGWRGVSLLLVGADGLDQAGASYASERWPDDWQVIGFEYEGCYFIDVGTGAVGYLDHGVGLRDDRAGADFVAFLEEVLAASTPDLESELHGAIAAYDRPRLERLLRKGRAPEPEQLTLLGAAVLLGAEEIVGWLLDQAVELEAVSPAAELTALGIAIGTGQRAMMLRLLERGASPEATDDQGRTALMWATLRGDEEVIAAALRAGATPLPEGWLEETKKAEAAGEVRYPIAGDAPSPAPAKPRTELPAELYAVGIGVVLALVIVVIALLIDLFD